MALGCPGAPQLSPIDFEHLKEKYHAQLIFIPVITVQGLTHFGTQ